MFLYQDPQRCHAFWLVFCYIHKTAPKKHGTFGCPRVLPILRSSRRPSFMWTMRQRFEKTRGFLMFFSYFSYFFLIFFLVFRCVFVWFFGVGVLKPLAFLGGLVRQLALGLSIVCEKQDKEHIPAGQIAWQRRTVAVSQKMFGVGGTFSGCFTVPGRMHISSRQKSCKKGQRQMVWQCARDQVVWFWCQVKHQLLGITVVACFFHSPIGQFDGFMTCRNSPPSLVCEFLETSANCASSKNP